MKRNQLAALFILTLVLAEAAYPAASPTQRHLTLLVVPARYNVLQVAFDIASLAPVVLVSYQGEASTEDPLLYAWNGSEWVYITMQDYREANFLQVTPGQAILVGDEKLLPPGLVTSVAGWCPKTMTVPTTDTTALLNALGGHLAFTSRDWKWIASRYNMSLQDLNTERRQESWYDQKGYRDELTPRLQSLPLHHRGRSARSAGTESGAEALAPGSVPPAEVMAEPSAVEVPAAVAPETVVPETAAPAVEPRLTIPAPQAEPEANAATPPDNWQEKAVSTELPVK